ncbi:MAG: RpiB/LacA/LacB family sugar-phosphate isomerase [Candidatus Liptonbacteria bacterium]|nr:RpiB/LacA/LacB family sugar-phosphate isomerase [Candidatus Liptonbacteria bacterium]
MYIGADHKGFYLKEALKNYLQHTGYEVVDVGNNVFDQNDDYPDFAFKVAKEVFVDPQSRKGIVICGSGAGVSVVVNKVPGIRAVLAISPDHIYQSRKDLDVNVLALAADFIDLELAKKIIGVWLQTPFSGEERHRRRINKIREIEEQSKSFT